MWSPLEQRSAPNQPNRGKGPRKNRGNGKNELRLVTANVTSWKSAQDYIKSVSEDFVLLQEIKASESQANNFRETAAKCGYVFHTGGSIASKVRSAGVMVAWRRHLAVKPQHFVHEDDRFAAVMVKTRGIRGGPHRVDLSPPEVAPV